MVNVVVFDFSNSLKTDPKKWLDRFRSRFRLKLCCGRCGSEVFGTMRLIMVVWLRNLAFFEVFGVKFSAKKCEPERQF